VLCDRLDAVAKDQIIDNPRPEEATLPSIAVRQEREQTLLRDRLDPVTKDQIMDNPRAEEGTLLPSSALQNLETESS
jgi:hypothetical protein